MPICVVAVTDDGSAVLDFSGQKLTEMVPLVDARPVVLIYDKNHITGIANLEHCEHCLEQVGAVPVLRNAFPGNLTPPSPCNNTPVGSVFLK